MHTYVLQLHKHKAKGKGKALPLQTMKAYRGEQRYGSALS